MYRNIKAFFDTAVGTMLQVALGIMFFAFVGFVIMYAWFTTVERFACDEYNKATGAKVHFSVWAGCYVTLPDGQVVHKDVAKKVFSNDYRIKVK